MNDQGGWLQWVGDRLQGRVESLDEIKVQMLAGAMHGQLWTCVRTVP